MKDFNLSEYIRYIIVGLASVLIYYYLSIDQSSVFKGFEILAIALVIGFIVYSFHRAVLYPLINSIILSLLHLIYYKNKKGKRLYIQLPWPNKNCIEYDRLRWKCIESGCEIKYLKEWGNQIHFLYCVSWIMLFYQIADKYCILNTYRVPRYWHWITLIVLVAAIIHQIRCQIYEMSILYD